MKVIDPLHGMAEELDAPTLAGLEGRCLYQTSDWSESELDQICRLAELFEGLERRGVPTSLFPNQLDYALFFDQSTRTRASWAGASSRLGSQPVIVDGGSTQVSHGESAEETGAMLGMNAHALGVRHDLILGEGNAFMRALGRGIADYLAGIDSERPCPVINLQCDVDHPTQTIADLCWLRERFGDRLPGKTIAVSWAYSPSYAKPLSVPQGLIMLLPRYGMDVRLAHPEGYELLPQCLELARRAAEEGDGGFTVMHDMDEAFQGAHVVYPKSWGPHELMRERVNANQARDQAMMRQIEERALERNRRHTDWICDERRMRSTAHGNALYMHCLPADIDAEVSARVMKRARLDVARQANKKLYAIMALLAATKNSDALERLRMLLP